MKKIDSKHVEVYARFVHVVAPETGKPLRVQAISEDSKLVTVKVNKHIFDRVRGYRHGEENNRIHMGLRNMSQVKFRAHFDKDGIMQGVDIVPNRTFTSGVAPRRAGEGRKQGFDLYVDEELNGFDVRSEDREGEISRTTYAGLSEIKLYEILDSLRTATWSGKVSQTLANHKVEKIEDGAYRVKPLGVVKYNT